MLFENSEPPERSEYAMAPRIGVHTIIAIHVALELSGDSDLKTATIALAEIQVIATAASQIRKRTVFGSMGSILPNVKDEPRR